jgi:hypothetical protein
MNSKAVYQILLTLEEFSDSIKELDLSDLSGSLEIRLIVNGFLTNPMGSGNRPKHFSVHWIMRDFFHIIHN